MKKLIKQQMVDKAIKIHSEYDYSLVSDDATTKDKISVLCPKHGRFEVSYHEHVYNKSKCPNCARAAKSKGTHKFIREATRLHNCKYDYSKVDYVNNYTKITIICPVHGEFDQTPYSHINYQNGCKKCGDEKRALKLDKFIDRANTIHNNKYDYSNVHYSNIKTKITIICPIHGEFDQTPDNHLYRKSGCPECANHVKYTQEYFKKHPKLQGCLYLLRLVNLENNESFLKIGITKHQSILDRFNRRPPADYQIEIVNTKHMVLKEAYEIEQKVLQQFSGVKYIPMNQFSGQTECFNDTPEIFNKLNEILEIDNGSHRNERS